MYRAMILLLISILSCSRAMAQDFYKEKYRGWYYFEEQKKKEKEEQQNKEKSAQGSSSTQETYKEKLDKYSKDIEESKAKMIMEPSVENTKDYIRKQNELFERTDAVVKNWRLSMLKDPSLKMNINDPTNHEGTEIAKKIKKQHDVSNINNLFSEYGLVFFYKSDCPYCHKFIEVLALLQKEYNFKIAGVSADDKELDELKLLPNYEHINSAELLEIFQVKYFPQVFAYSEERNEAIPISSGFVAYDEFYDNLRFVSKHIYEEGKTNE